MKENDKIGGDRGRLCKGCGNVAANCTCISEISKLDECMENLRKDKVSEPVDLDELEELIGRNWTNEAHDLVVEHCEDQLTKKEKIKFEMDILSLCHDYHKHTLDEIEKAVEAKKQEADGKAKDAAEKMHLRKNRVAVAKYNMCEWFLNLINRGQE